MYDTEVAIFNNKPKFDGDMSYLSENVERYDGNELADILITNIAACLSEYDDNQFEYDKVYEFSHLQTVSILNQLTFLPNSYVLFNKMLEVTSYQCAREGCNADYFVKYYFGESGNVRTRVVKAQNSEYIWLPEFDKFYTFTSAKECFQILSYLNDFYSNYLRKTI